ncbi:MAG: hypothetical protein IJD92_03980 [Bacilli bacterium]|nr:hypothetical protein [Bacilli bacterium]
MELNIIYKIKQNKKHYDFLRTHSYWYKYLNRNSNNYEKFIQEYKKYSREVTTNKVNDTINNIDMVTNIIKVL